MGGKLGLTENYTYKEQASRSIAWGHYFLFFNIILAIIIGSAYVYAAPGFGSFVSFLYLGTTWLGHMCFLSCVVYLILLFPLSFIGNYRWYRVLSVIICVIFFTILLFDVKLYLNVRVHLSAMSLGLIFTQLDFNTGLNYNFLLIAVPLVIIIELALAKLATRTLYKEAGYKKQAAVLVLLGACFVASHCLHIWADAYQYDRITVLRSVFPAHYPMTAKSFLTSHGYLDPDTPRREQIFNMVYPLEPIRTEAASKQNHVIAVSINGLSYSGLSSAVTPNLLKLKEHSQSYENHYLPYDSLKDNYFAMAYGLSASYQASLREANQAPVVVNELYRQEYTARVIESSYDQGEDEGTSYIMGIRSIAIEQGAGNRAVIAKALSEIASWRRDEHYMLTLSLNDLLKAQNEEEYQRMLSATDSALGELFDYLEQSGILNDTLLMVTSSQGSSFISDGSRYYDRQKNHVPMLVLWPHSDRVGASIGELSSHYDICPTVGREILGIVNRSGEYSLGYDLMDLPRREYVISDEDHDIILVGLRSNSVYTNEGQVFSERAGTRLEQRPSLESLISAMRELNRFLE